MKKVFFTLSIIATLISCTTEEMSETQDLSFAPSSVDTFEGDYTAYETLINGEVSDTCETTWAFNANGTMRIDRNLPCIDGPASSGVRQFSTDDNNLYITIDGYTAPYPEMARAVARPTDPGIRIIGGNEQIWHEQEWGRAGERESGGSARTSCTQQLR